MAMVVLSAFGVIISGYSLLQKQGLASGSFCTINATFDCDVVNKGPYGSLFGVPVSLIGVVGYGLLLIGSVMHLRSLSDRLLSGFLLVSSTGGLGFALYLTGIEAFVLDTYCLLCLTSQALILGLFTLSVAVFKQKESGPA